MVFWRVRVVMDYLDEPASAGISIYEQMEDMTPKELDKVAGVAQRKANMKRKERIEETGGSIIEKLNTDICVDGITYMLNNKASVVDTLAYVARGEDGWMKKVKNKPLSAQTRREITTVLRYELNKGQLPALGHLVDNKYLTLNEIKDTSTYNNQLKKVNKHITLADRVSELEKEVIRLSKFEEEQKAFNQVVVEQVSTQRTIINNILDHFESSKDWYVGSVEQVTELRTHLSLIDNKKDKVRYLLDLNLRKSDIASIMDVSRMTVHRIIKSL